MLAVIKLGGAQHIVKKDDIITVNKLDSNVGEEITITDVLSTTLDGETKMGFPILANSSVRLKVLEQGKDKKVLVFKKKRRQNYRRKNGHRQHITKVQVLEVL
ncbi:50S ribosomal protein L21 [Candidatus Hepatincolaceae symbiont of Richtersius coronifer]